MEIKQYYIISIHNPEYFFIEIAPNSIGITSVHSTIEVNKAKSFNTIEEAEIILEKINKLFSKPTYGIIKKSSPKQS